MGPFLKQLDHPKLFHDPELGLGPRAPREGKYLLEDAFLLALFKGSSGVQLSLWVSGIGFFFGLGVCDFPKSQHAKPPTPLAIHDTASCSSNVKHPVQHVV